MAGLLAIDVSNSHTALAVWHGDRATRHWQLTTDRRRTPDELRLLLAQLFASAGLSARDIDDCVLGSVVPDVVAPLVAACREAFGVEPLVVGPGVRSGLRVRTEDPRDVGADRVANAVAASERFGAPVRVLDFATALTIDVVDAAGDYAGAIIAPGLDVSADALARQTAQLPRGPSAPPERAIGTSTDEGLQAGLFFGYVGLVSGLVARLAVELGPAPVVATGEAAWLPALLDQCPAIDAYEPLLTLDGLRRIHERHSHPPPGRTPAAP
jgi:type III pantothenate kinase